MRASTIHVVTLRRNRLMTAPPPSTNRNISVEVSIPAPPWDPVPPRLPPPQPPPELRLN